MVANNREKKPRVRLPRQVRRRFILDSARKLLIDRGYQEILLDDVAEKARISKGTIYLYFEDKEKLFAAVLSDALEALETRVRALPTNVPAKDSLLRFVSVILEYFEENEDLLERLFRHKYRFCSTHEEKALKERMVGILRFIAERFENCVREKQFRSIDPMRGALFLVALLKVDLLAKPLETGSRTLEERADEIMDLFLNGVTQHG